MGIDVGEISSTNIWKKQAKISLKLNVLDYDYLIIDRLIDRLKLKFKSDLISSNIWKVSKKDEINEQLRGEIKKM